MNPLETEVEFWLDAYKMLFLEPPTHRRRLRDAWWKCPWSAGQILVDLGNGSWRHKGEKGDFVEAMRRTRAAGMPLS